MTDKEYDIFHVIGGGLAALIVLVAGHNIFVVYRIFWAIVAGAGGNALWEIFVDKLHWVFKGFAANTWDDGDVLLGALGAVAVVLIYAMIFY